MEGFEWKIVSSMEKVFPVREPSGEGVREKLTALRGETVSFQIAYRWSGSRREKCIRNCAEKERKWQGSGRYVWFPANIRCIRSRMRII